MELVIRNGKIVTPTEIVSAGIAIDNGKIVAIGREDLLPTADKTIDASGKYILPGLIDPHTHPGFGVTFESSVRTETQAAAVGGVTTMSIYVRDVKRGLVAPFDEYRRHFESNAVTDGFFHLMVSNEQSLDEIPRCPDLGVTGFKFSIGYKGPQAEAMGIPPIDDGFVLDGFRRISNLGYPARAMVHAENIDIALRLRKGLEQRQDVRVWHDSRPNFVEEECMYRCLFLAKVSSCPLYIVHITIKEGADIINKARAEGINVIAETCPQYLTHNSEEPVLVIKENPTFAVVNPPLRGKEDNERLWQAIKDGVIDCIGSDQAAATKKLKGNDMWKAPMGLGNITQMILPVMLSEGVNKNRISLEKVVEVCCQNPAKVFGLYPRKGTISVHSDADLVIIDLNKKVKFTPQMSPSLCDWNIYDGWEFKGWPVCTILRGKVIAEDGKVVVKPGTGRYILPER